MKLRCELCAAGTADIVACVIAIRKRRDAGEKLKAIGKDYGLAESSVHMIATRKKWKHVPGVIK